MTKIYTKEDIKQLIPHREPMLLVDEAYVEEGVAHGKFQVTGEEWFLQGHFPGMPVVPGVIQCEIMAQTCCVLLVESAGELTPMFTGLNNVRFKHSVVPGDLLELECEIVKSKGPFYFAKGRGSVDGRLCVSGEFSFALVENKEG